MIDYTRQSDIEADHFNFNTYQSIFDNWVADRQTDEHCIILGLFVRTVL